jgi:hypothetical protein
MRTRNLNRTLILLRLHSLHPPRDFVCVRRWLGGGILFFARLFVDVDLGASRLIQADQKLGMYSMFRSNDL